MRPARLLLLFGFFVFAISQARGQCGPCGLESGLDIPGLFPTGVDDQGNLLGSGTPDPHYTILGIGPAVVFSPPYSGWYRQETTSRWIWQTASGQPTNVTRTFRLVFDLTGFNPSTVTLSGEWVTDNFGDDILINSTPTGNTSLTFATPTSFSISSGFVAGLNTLDFVVRDVGIVAGFRVLSIRGCTSQTPPTTCMQFCDANGVSATPCPCGNNNDGSAGQPAGCDNGQPNLTGGVLRCVGVPKISMGPPSSGGLQLVTCNVSKNVGLFLQGTTTAAGGLGTTLGDGLLCVSGTITRLEVVLGNSNRVAVSTVDLAAKGHVTMPGTRYYQYWFRDIPGSPCSKWTNLTNGVQVDWTL